MHEMSKSIEARSET